MYLRAHLLSMLGDRLVERAPTPAWALVMVIVNLSLAHGAEAQAADRPWLEAALDARGLYDDAFGTDEVYSWTTTAQAELLAGDGRLLRSTAADGRARSPYQRALDDLAASTTAPSDDVALARLLSTHPSLAARRYAWTTPYGAAVPRGQRSYGRILLRIELDPRAWHARFAPSESPAFRVVDASGARVPTASLIAAPWHLASVLHARAEDREGAFREIIVHGQVRRWSMGTPAIAARIEEDRRVLAALRRVVREGPRRAARWLAPFWQRRRTVGGLSARWAATIPFETPRHRMTDEALAGIEEAMNERAVLRVAPVEREGATAASRAAESRAH